MIFTPTRKIFLMLSLLLFGAACTGSSCGGCTTPLAEPFPEAPRVYDGVQIRISQSGFSFVEQNLPEILDSMLTDGLNFEIPSSTTTILGTDIDLCRSPCPVSAEILESRITLISPDKISLNGTIDLDSTITVDSILGHCEFPLQLRQKPLSAQAQLLVDSSTYLLYYDVGDLEVTIGDDDYDIQCPAVYDWLLELLKSYITNVLNSQLQQQMDSTIDDLIAAQTCLPCDYYSNGCPSGSSCDQDGFCQASSHCVIKPQGLAGTVELGAMVASVDPANDATVHLLIAGGQAQQANQRPFVRSNGLEVRIIGGTFSEQDQCVPDPDPSEIPSTGIATPMQFGNLIPGQGQPYMAAVSVAGMYLNHFIYQLWRSGFLCLTIDSASLDMISSSTLALILPSIGALSEGDNLPVRMELHPQGVPEIEIGAGTFLPDGSVDGPILYLFLPNLRLDLWMKMFGRWERILSLSQDVEVDLALDFTPDNQVIPMVDENSISVRNVQLLQYELLAESEDQLIDLVPSLINLALPQLLDSLQGISLPDMQGFHMNVKALQGDMPKASTPYYEFMSIYADLDFIPPEATLAAKTLAEVTQLENGFVITNKNPGTEIQYRMDKGMWSTFKRGDKIRVKLPCGLYPQRLQIRARKIGDYRTLDPIIHLVELQKRISAKSAFSQTTPVQHEQARAISSANDSDALNQSPAAGCSEGPSPVSIWQLLSGLMVLVLLRRRFPSPQAKRHKQHQQ